jgi:hypothetical protein
VRREAMVAALVAFPVLACGPTARGDGQAPPAERGSEAVAAASLGLKSDVFSGCVEGAPLVKILIRLRPSQTTKGCTSEVTPASVCVARGGVVRFKIENGCRDRPPIEITQPTWKKLPGLLEAPVGKADARLEAWKVFANCELKLASGVELLRCDVGSLAFDGFYKYSVKGERVDELDPDVEVRGGR